jgi:hypothetical protein
MNWLKKTFGKSETNDKQESKSIPNIQVSTFTLYTITGLVDNLTEDDWTNSEFDPLTETEKNYVLKIAQENTGKIFYTQKGEYDTLIRGYTKSCDKGRAKLFLGRQIQGKSFVGSISKINNEYTSIRIKYPDNTEKEITDKSEIQEILELIGKV